MLLTAIKEMKVKKGASIVAIFKYVQSIYKYDVQRNRRILKRTLEKLIAEKVVEQVKGHGLAGSFKLGRNYKEQLFCNRSKKQVSLKKNDYLGLFKYMSIAIMKLLEGQEIKDRLPDPLSRNYKILHRSFL